MGEHIKKAIIANLVLTVLLGVLYPLAITAIAQVTMPGKANGSLIEKDGKVVGSSLIGQQFDDPAYFWGRLSATGPVPYNSAASSGSNLGPLNPALHDAVQGRIAALQSADPDNTDKVPVDLVTSSGSGLDPHISIAAAQYQAPRIARLRKLDPSAVAQMIDRHTDGRSLGVLGEPGVNVLELNLELDSKTGVPVAAPAPAAETLPPATVPADAPATAPGTGTQAPAAPPAGN